MNSQTQSTVRCCEISSAILSSVDWSAKTFDGFVVSIVPPGGLAPLGAGTSASKMVFPHIYTRPMLNYLGMGAVREGDIVVCWIIACVVTVYPKKYAHGFCFAVLCCGYTLTDFPISIRLTSLALWQSNDCPSASKATLMNMDKYFMWIHYERLHNHSKAKHNKTVCIFLGIYCILRLLSLICWVHIPKCTGNIGGLWCQKQVSVHAKVIIVNSLMWDQLILFLF